MADSNQSDELELSDIQEPLRQTTRMPDEDVDQDFNETLDSEAIDDQLEDSNLP